MANVHRINDYPSAGPPGGSAQNSLFSAMN